MVSDSLALAFDSHFMCLFCPEATNKKRSKKPCNLALNFLQISCGNAIVEKNDAAHRPSPLTYCLFRPWNQFPYVFSEFERLPGLWAWRAFGRVVACGSRWPICITGSYTFDAVRHPAPLQHKRSAVCRMKWDLEGTAGIADGTLSGSFAGSQP